MEPKQSFESILDSNLPPKEKSEHLKRRWYLLKDCEALFEKAMYNDEELSDSDRAKIHSLYPTEIIEKAGFWLESDFERIGYLFFKELNKAKRYFLNLDYPGLDKLFFGQKGVTFNTTDPTAGTDYSLSDKENKRTLIIKERYGCLLISFEEKGPSKYNSLHYQVNPTDSKTIDKPEDVAKVIAAFFGLKKFDMDIIDRLEELNQDNWFEFEDPMGSPSRYE